MEARNSTGLLGGCHVTIELAGPTLPQSVNVNRILVGRMAGWVLNYCVVREGGLGGFVTHGVRRLIDYSMNPASVLTDPYRKFLSSAYKGEGSINKRGLL